MIRNLDRLQISFHGGGWATLPPGSTFGPRILNDYEFLWVLEGDCVARYDGVQVELRPGSVILARDGMEDYYQWDPARKTRAGYIHFAFKRNGCVLPPENEWPLVQHPREGDVLHPLLRHLMWLMDRAQEQQAELARGAARQLLAIFLTGDFQTSPVETDSPPAVVRVIKTVQQRWNQQRELATPSLSELARIAHMSEGHLCRVFQQALGFGPVRALRIMRLDRAASMLAESNTRIHEISYLTGFENPYHFSRAFKNLFGLAPREYRRQAGLRKVVPQTHLITVRRIAGPFWE